MEEESPQKDQQEKTSRVNQIEKARKFFSNFMKCLLFLAIYLIVFELIESLFRVYQKNVDGIEYIIREKSFGLITGWETDWEAILYKIKWLVFSEVLLITIAVLTIYYFYRYIQSKKKLPKMYHNFLNIKQIFWENAIIPLGLIIGTFLGFFIFLMMMENVSNTNTIYIIFGLIPLFFILIASFLVFKEGNKSMKIKYLISIVIILIFQF